MVPAAFGSKMLFWYLYIWWPLPLLQSIPVAFSKKEPLLGAWSVTGVFLLFSMMVGSTMFSLSLVYTSYQFVVVVAAAAAAACLRCHENSHHRRCTTARITD